MDISLESKLLTYFALRDSHVKQSTAQHGTVPTLLSTVNPVKLEASINPGLISTHMFDSVYLPEFSETIVMRIRCTDSRLSR